jgi:hypothetical protein
MELDADEEVVAEYPLYVASFGALSNQEDIRLAQVQYPLRPTWRGYRIVDATEVRYKPNHRILDISVPEDEASTVCTSICFFWIHRIPERAALQYAIYQRTRLASLTI